MFIFILFKSSSWGHFFGEKIFFCSWRRLRAPTIFFLSGLGTSSGPLRTSKMCVLPRENHYFYIFVYVVLDLDLGPSKSSSGAPKVGLVNFFKFRRADFIASLKFSKNSRGQLGPQEAVSRGQKSVQNRFQKDIFFTFLGFKNSSQKTYESIGPASILLMLDAS